MSETYLKIEWNQGKGVKVWTILEEEKIDSIMEKLKNDLKRG